MGLIDFILNIAGLLLWLSWRMAKSDPMAGATPATLAGTLRRADKPKLRGWHYPLALGLLIFLRAVVYWQIGSAVNWSASLGLAVISIPFRSDLFGRILLFSALSFSVTLAAFLLCMLFLSMISRRNAEFDAVRRFVRLQIGFLDGLPAWLKLFVPFISVSLLWWILSWLLEYRGLLPQAVSGRLRVEQSGVIGLSSYLSWKYIIAGVLTLHAVSSYVYLGSHPYWGSVTAVARQMLRPLKPVPLSAGRVDFAPLVGIALVFILSRMAEAWLAKLYSILPF